MTTIIVIDEGSGNEIARYQQGDNELPKRDDQIRIERDTNPDPIINVRRIQRDYDNNELRAFGEVIRTE